uniref:Uncharacterized protein n=1 Tax=Strongyloides venezuelensis TaxID=75913 RepID=A0A0K0G0H8_STRVS
MFSQIKAFIIAWSFFYLHIINGYPSTTTISPFLNLLNHHVYYYNNPLLNHQLTSSSTIPLNFISPAVNSLHLSHEQLTQHFNHLHEQYLNNLFGSSDFNHHPFHHYLATTVIKTSTQSPFPITTGTTTRSPTPILVESSLTSDEKQIDIKPIEKNELKINKLNGNLPSPSINFDELLRNSKLDEKEKEEFLKTFQKVIEKELEKRQKKKLIIKTTTAEISDVSKNITDSSAEINIPTVSTTVKAQGAKIVNSNENNVNSKELLDNFDVMTKAFEHFLDVEREKNINTPDKSLPLNEEEIENVSRREENDEESNYKMNEQEEFDRFIKSKINEKMYTSTTPIQTATATSTTTTKTPTTIKEKDTTTPSTVNNILRRRLPPTRYNTEFERLAQDYQERLMMAAGGIEEDVFKILRNAKIALYSSSNSKNQKKH